MDTVWLMWEFRTGNHLAKSVHIFRRRSTVKRWLTEIKHLSIADEFAEWMITSPRDGVWYKAEEHAVFDAGDLEGLILEESQS